MPIPAILWPGFARNWSGFDGILHPLPQSLCESHAESGQPRPNRCEIGSPCAEFGESRCCMLRKDVALRGVVSPELANSGGNTHPMSGLGRHAKALVLPAPRLAATAFEYPPWTLCSHGWRLHRLESSFWVKRRPLLHGDHNVPSPMLTVLRGVPPSCGLPLTRGSASSRFLCKARRRCADDLTGELSRSPIMVWQCATR